MYALCEKKSTGEIFCILGNDEDGNVIIRGLDESFFIEITEEELNEDFAPIKQFSW